MKSPALVCRWHAAFHTHTSSVVCCTNCTYDSVRWTAEKIDAVKQIETQHKQNAVHVVRQQTASHEGTDVMSDPYPRRHRCRVLYRISLPRSCVRSWMDIRRIHQAICWKMFLPSAAAAHCSPDTDHGCSQYISTCFYNQLRGLLQQWFFGNSSAVHLYPLQSMLHAAARVITRKRKYHHISATIRDQLHWLPVKQRINQVVHSHLHVLTQCSASVSAWHVHSSVIDIGSFQPPVGYSRRFIASAHKKINIGPSCFCDAWTIHMEHVAATGRHALLTYGQFCSKLRSVIFNRAYMTWTVAFTW